MVCKSCGNGQSGNSVAIPLASAPVQNCSSCSQPSALCSCDRFCEEDHITRTVFKQYGFTIRVKSAFVWPAVSQKVTLLVDAVDRISVGSLLWNPNAGWLVVDSFDFSAQTIVAKNTGIACNTYHGGETLPECTDLVLGPPTCAISSVPLPNTSYLAADFISPAVGNCGVAAVTNLIGLTLHDTVIVNGYEYSIGAVLTSETISLCNDGQGAALGTIIKWDDNSDGLGNTPIIKVASENPCSRPGTQFAALMACDAGVAKPYQGSVDGQVPVWQVSSGRWLPLNLPIPLATCSALTVPLTVDPSHVGSYPISVSSTTSFSTKIVLIGAVQYIVNTVDSGTTAHVTPVVTPPAIATYPSGTPVCIDPNPVDNEECTLVTGTFSVNNSSYGPYFLTVNNSSVFSPGMTVIINDWLFIVTTIPNVSSINLLQVTLPAANRSFAAGSRICTAYATYQASAVTTFTSPTGAAGTGGAGTGVLEFSYTNHSARKSKQVVITLAGTFSSVDVIQGTGAHPIEFDLQYTLVDSTLLTSLPFPFLEEAIAGEYFSRKLSKEFLYNLAPGASIDFKGRFFLQGTSANPIFLGSKIYAELTAKIYSE